MQRVSVTWTTFPGKGPGSACGPFGTLVKSARLVSTSTGGFAGGGVSSALTVPMPNTAPPAAAAEAVPSTFRKSRRSTPSTGFIET